MIQLKTKAAFNTDFLVYTELLAATFVCVETKASSFIGSTSLTSTVCQTKKKMGITSIYQKTIVILLHNPLF